MDIRETIGRERPCNYCRQLVCTDTQCCRWQEWFLDRWAALHRYAWAARDELGRQEPDRFCYELPHMCKSPCDQCPCGSWCDSPCSLRIKWWDARIGILKRKLGDRHALR